MMLVISSSGSKILLLVITTTLVIIIMIIVSEGRRATVRNWPFGQPPSVVGYCCWLLCAVFFLLNIVGCSWLLLIVSGCC